jgi:hypothetical protein
MISDYNSRFGGGRNTLSGLSSKEAWTVARNGFCLTPSRFSRRLTPPRGGYIVPLWIGGGFIARRGNSWRRGKRKYLSFKEEVYGSERLFRTLKECIFCRTLREESVECGSWVSLAQLTLLLFLVNL